MQFVSGLKARPKCRENALFPKIPLYLWTRLKLRKEYSRKQVTKQPIRNQKSDACLHIAFIAYDSGLTLMSYKVASSANAKYL